MTALLDRVSPDEALSTRLDELRDEPAAAPERSLVQRLEALAEANRIRTYRKLVKRDLKAGRCTLHDLLLEPADELLSMKVFDLILAAPKYGRVKTNKILQLCRVSPSKTIGGLSPRQRTEIVSMLRR